MKTRSNKKKSIFLFLTLILVQSVLLISFPSCNKYAGKDLMTSKTLYERETKSTPSESPFADHLIKLEWVSTYNATVENIFQSDEWAQINANLGDSIRTDSIFAITFDNTGIMAYEFRIKNPTKYKDGIIFYSFKNKFLPTRFNETQESGYYRYTLFSYDRSMEYYHLLRSKLDNTVGGITFVNDMPFISVFGNNGDNQIGTCYETTTSFGACMQCAIAECASDWVCAVVCACEPEWCMIGFGLSCGGVRVPPSPNQTK